METSSTIRTFTPSHRTPLFAEADILQPLDNYAKRITQDDKQVRNTADNLQKKLQQEPTQCQDLRITLPNPGTKQPTLWQRTAQKIEQLFSNLWKKISSFFTQNLPLPTLRLTEVALYHPLQYPLRGFILSPLLNQPRHPKNLIPIGPLTP